VAAVHFTFASAEAPREAMAAEGTVDVLADVANYTSIDRPCPADQQDGRLSCAVLDAGGGQVTTPAGGVRQGVDPLEVPDDAHAEPDPGGPERRWRSR